MWKSKHDESKEKRQTEQEEMKEETHELEQVEQDAQEEIRENEDEDWSFHNNIKKPIWLQVLIISWKETIFGDKTCALIVKEWNAKRDATVTVIGTGIDKPY